MLKTSIMLMYYGKLSKKRNFRDRDNLLRKDKTSAPKVSFLRRFVCSSHCMPVAEQGSWPTTTRVEAIFPLLI